MKTTRNGVMQAALVLALLTLVVAEDMNVLQFQAFMADFTPSDLSTPITLLFDASGSISTNDFAAEKKATTELLNALKQKKITNISVYSFSSVSTRVCNGLENCIENIEKTGHDGQGTYLGAALQKVEKNLGLNAKDAIVLVLTDGYPSDPDVVKLHSKKFRALYMMAFGNDASDLSRFEQFTDRKNILHASGIGTWVNLLLDFGSSGEKCLTVKASSWEGKLFTTYSNVELNITIENNCNLAIPPGAVLEVEEISNFLHCEGQLSEPHYNHFNPDIITIRDKIEAGKKVDIKATLRTLGHIVKGANYIVPSRAQFRLNTGIGVWKGVIEFDAFWFAKEILESVESFRKQASVLTGANVVFCGYSGSGKSTTINKIMQSLCFTSREECSQNEVPVCALSDRHCTTYVYETEVTNIPITITDTIGMENPTSNNVKESYDETFIAHLLLKNLPERFQFTTSAKLDKAIKCNVPKTLNDIHHVVVIVLTQGLSALDKDDPKWVKTRDVVELALNAGIPVIGVATFMQQIPQCDRQKALEELRYLSTISEIYPISEYSTGVKGKEAFDTQLEAFNLVRGLMNAAQKVPKLQKLRNSAVPAGYYNLKNKGYLGCDEHTEL